MSKAEKVVIGAALVLALLLGGFAGLRGQPVEYQEMSASGYIFKLEDGSGTTQLTVDDDGALNVVGAADFDSTLNVDGAATLAGVTWSGTVDLNGQKLDLDADADTSLTADTDDQVDVEIGGADIQTWKDWGASTITTDTTKHLFEIADSTNVMTAGTNSLAAFNIDLGIGDSTAGTNSVYGILIDNISQDAQNTETAIALGGTGWDIGFDVAGNMVDLDADNDTSITADTDDQIDIEISGADDFQFTANTFSALSGSTIEANNISEETADAGVTIDDELTVSSTFFPSYADETITDGETLTPTKTFYNLDSAGAVTVTLAATGTEGQLLILCGDDANDITIADSNIRTNDGNAQVLNQYDCITLIYVDSEWVELSESNNS